MGIHLSDQAGGADLNKMQRKRLRWCTFYACSSIPQARRRRQSDAEKMDERAASTWIGLSDPAIGGGHLQLALNTTGIRLSSDWPFERMEDQVEKTTLFDLHS